MGYVSSHLSSHSALGRFLNGLVNNEATAPFVTIQRRALAKESADTADSCGSFGHRQSVVGVSTDYLP